MDLLETHHFPEVPFDRNAVKTSATESRARGMFIGASSWKCEDARKAIAALIGIALAATRARPWVIVCQCCGPQGIARTAAPRCRALRVLCSTLTLLALTRFLPL